MVDKNEKYRKTNLTNDRKTQIRLTLYIKFAFETVSRVN